MRKSYHLRIHVACAQGEMAEACNNPGFFQKIGLHTVQLYCTFKT